MQPIMMPKFMKLRGERAIEALHDFMNEFEEQRGKELTEKQATALIKLAKGLISLIEAEKQSYTSDENVKKMRFASKLKQTIMKYIPKSVQIHENCRFWRS